MKRNLLAVAATSLVALVGAPAAQAAFPNDVFGSLTCTVQPANGYVRLCGGKTPTFDGTGIDVNVILPPAPVSGPDGPYPAIGTFHGWGGSKIGLSDPRTQAWAQNGYVVFSMSDRGWGNSCGASDPDRTNMALCGHGYNHLLDDRYEVRDAQYLLSILADEGAIIPNKIGVTGPSYGGGMSMALAALKDRIMMPDGSLAPWKSPGNLSMQIAAAAPDIPWTDLAYSLQPNGHTLDYAADSPYMKRGRIGVMKQSFVAGLYALGQAGSNYAPPGTDMNADLTTWYGAINAGEPYDGNPLSQHIVDEITTHHSSYYIDHSETPAPLLISNGWTDDLFPPDEAIRFYNRTRAEHPGADLSLLFMSWGHQRGQGKAADVALLRARQDAWFDYYLKGTGAAPFRGIETLTTTCPNSAPSAGPYFASDWASLAPGEVRFGDQADQTVVPGAGDPSRGQAYDPISGSGACATAAGSDQPGAASYRLTVPAGGFTLMGSPTIVADINSKGPTTQVAARLLDIDPSTGNATLVARGIYRPEINGDTKPTQQVFQLHPNGWKFDPGHIVKLELLPNDSPYGRASNGQAPYTVSNLELRLPVLEQPNGGLISQPAPKLLPPGYALAPGYQASAPLGGGGSGGGGQAAPAAPGASKKCQRQRRAHGKRKHCKHKKRHRAHH